MIGMDVNVEFRLWRRSRLVEMSPAEAGRDPLYIERGYLVRNRKRGTEDQNQEFSQFDGTHQLLIDMLPGMPTPVLHGDLIEVVAECQGGLWGDYPEGGGPKYTVKAIDHDPGTGVVRAGLTAVEASPAQEVPDPLEVLSTVVEDLSYVDPPVEDLS